MNGSSHANGAEIGLSILGKIRKVSTAQRGVVVVGGIGRRDERRGIRSIKTETVLRKQRTRSDNSTAGAEN